MNNKQFHEERRKGIGGSDIAAIMGLTKWRSPMDVYAEKKGLVDSIDETEPMFWGKKLEPLVIDRYRELSGNSVLYNAEDKPIVHPKFDFMRATLDGQIMKAEKPVGVLEAKTSSPFVDGWGVSGTDEIPDAYLLQVQYYMGVTGLSFADLAALIGGNSFKVYHIVKNDKLIAVIFERVKKFWQDILNSNPPDIDGSEMSKKVLARLYPTDTGEVIEATEDVETYAESLKNIKEHLAKYENLKMLYENKLKKLMGDASVVIGNNFKISWKAVESKPKPDFQKAFENAPITEKKRQELINKYQKSSKSYRRFLASGELFKGDNQ